MWSGVQSNVEAESSAVQLGAMWPPVQCSAGKEELHESICVEGGSGGGQSHWRVHKKTASPAGVAKTPTELIEGTLAT